MSSIALFTSLLVAVSLPGLGLALVIALARRYLRSAGGQVADAAAHDRSSLREQPPFVPTEGLAPVSPTRGLPLTPERLGASPWRLAIPMVAVASLLALAHW